MNIVKFYKEVPVEKHSEIVVSGGRLFFEGDEYLVTADGELKLLRSDKELKQKIDQIGAILSVSNR